MSIIRQALRIQAGGGITLVADFLQERAEFRDPARELMGDVVLLPDVGGQVVKFNRVRSRDMRPWIIVLGRRIGEEKPFRVIGRTVDLTNLLQSAG